MNLLLFGRIAGQNLLELVDGLLGIAIVVGRIGAGNVLLGVGGCQIKTGIDQAGIQLHRVLEMFDGFFVACVLVGLNALVELVACSQLVAAHG